MWWWKTMKICQVCVLCNSPSCLAAFGVFCLRVIHSFCSHAVGRRVHSNYSHCVTGRVKRHWGISRGVSNIFTFSSLLKCKILAVVVKKYLSGRCCQAELPCPLGVSATTPVHITAIRRECLELLWLISIPFWLVDL